MRRLLIIGVAFVGSTVVALALNDRSTSNNEKSETTIDGSTYGIGYSFPLKGCRLEFYQTKENGIQLPVVTVAGVRQVSAHQVEQRVKDYFTDENGHEQTTWRDYIWQVEGHQSYLVSYASSNGTKKTFSVSPQTLGPNQFVLNQPVTVGWEKTLHGWSVTETAVGFLKVTTPFKTFTHCLVLKEYIRYPDGTTSTVNSYYTNETPFVRSDIGWVGDDEMYTDKNDRVSTYNVTLSKVIWNASNKDWDNLFAPGAPFDNIQKYDSFR